MPDTSTAAPGVVHLGLGAFHRAHQAMVFDTLLKQGDPRWGVLGVAMRSAAVADALRAQAGRYSVQVASAQGREWQVVESIRATCVAAQQPQAVMDAIAAPATRWITLTVTEKGYGPALAALVVGGLAQRHRAGLPGLTIASCDNLSGNGDKLRALCLQGATDPALQEWIATACAFPNSMVDRIVPAATEAARAHAAQALGWRDEAALATEGFWEWVLQDRLADPLDAAVLASAGVQVVPDIAPYETAKLRMLNGSHSAMAAMGAVLGLPTICDCITDTAIKAFVQGLMTQEVMPHVTRPQPEAYRDALLARFANPALQHSVHQVATDSTQKIPQRWVPAALDQFRAGGPVEHLAFASAAWMRYALGEDEAGRSYDLNDPLAAEVMAGARAHRGNAAATAHALLGLTAVWGHQLPANPVWRARVTHWLGRIQGAGLRAALAEVR
ncbi:MAG TPA: mannitol dehydrogenase family protein [Ramlibacter sp.]|nr:mannitol dehydrogenase family protein [Ramlibacter sp.]